MQLCSLSLSTIKALVQTGASSVIFVVIAMCNANSVADVCTKLVMLILVIPFLQPPYATTKECFVKSNDWAFLYSK